MNPTAHSDTFTRDHLPPADQQPVFLKSLPALDFPARLNCVDVLLDRHVREGHGDRVAVRSLEEAWTYAELQDRVNRIANLLVDEMGVASGNRVLLRFPNSPLFAACYLAVLKCGAVAVPTMPLLRAKELRTIAEKAMVSHAVADSALAAELAEVGIESVIESDDIVDRIGRASADFEALVRHAVHGGEFDVPPDRREAWFRERVRRHRQPSESAFEQRHASGRWILVKERATRDGGVAGIRLRQGGGYR